MAAEHGVTSRTAVRPRVSVVVVSGASEAALDRTLESVVDQSFASDQFEVVVVRPAAPQPPDDRLRALRDRRPALAVRLVEVASDGLAEARSVGVALARGERVMLLDADTWIAPTCLARLDAVTEPGVVPIAFVDDAFAPVNEALAGHSGAVVDAAAVADALAMPTARLVPTSWARRAAFVSPLPGEDLVHWAAVFTEAPFRVRVADIEGGPSCRPAAPVVGTGYDDEVVARLDLIADLERSHQPTATARRFVAALVSCVCRQVNAYLRAHPDAHHRLRADARARSLRTLDWAALNRGLARELAVLYSFTPYVDTSALVAARRIWSHGEVVDVITHRNEGLRETDPASPRIAEEFVATTRVVTDQPTFSEWDPIEAFSEAALVGHELLEGEFGPYRSIYSRAMWPASHLAAARIKLRRPDLRWRAEFSDPLLHNLYGEMRTIQIPEGSLLDELRAGLRDAGHQPPDHGLLFDWIERLPYALSDELVFTNENQAEYMLGYHEDRELAARAHDIARVSAHPTLPPEFYEIEPASYDLEPGRAAIGYFGAFYPTRGLTEVMSGLDALDGTTRARISLHVFTEKPNEVRGQVRHAGFEDVIRVNGYLPYLAFLNLTTRLDVLLVNDAATRGHHPLNPYLPSKLADYLGSGRPVWGLHEPGSVLSRLPLEFNTTLGDVDAARDVLAEIARRWGVSG